MRPSYNFMICCPWQLKPKLEGHVPTATLDLDRKVCDFTVRYSRTTSLTAQQNVFQKQVVQSNAIIHASMRIFHIIGKKMKPFSDGEYNKECLMAAVEKIAPDKMKDFKISFKSVSICFIKL